MNTGATSHVTSAVSPIGGRAPDRPRPWMVRRWPTWLALALAVLTWGGTAADYAGPLALAALAYLIPVAIRWRAATWPVAVTVIVTYVGMEVIGGPDPRMVFVAVAAAALAAGLVVNRPGHRSDLWIQAAGMVVFGALAFAGAGATPDLAVWVVAGGWFAHGLWDAVHLWTDRAVSRSYAEWCAVVDILVAAELVAAGLLLPS